MSIGSSQEIKNPDRKTYLKLGFGKPLFTRADRHYVDPPLSNQDIGLISFVPCNDAKPNKYGVYGFELRLQMWMNQIKSIRLIQKRLN